MWTAGGHVACSLTYLTCSGGSTGQWNLSGKKPIKPVKKVPAATDDVSKNKFLPKNTTFLLTPLHPPKIYKNKINPSIMCRTENMYLKPLLLLKQCLLPVTASMTTVVHHWTNLCMKTRRFCVDRTNNCCCFCLGRHQLLMCSYTPKTVPPALIAVARTTCRDGGGWTQAVMSGSHLGVSSSSPRYYRTAVKHVTRCGAVGSEVYFGSAART